MTDARRTIEDRLRWSGDHRVEIDGASFTVMEWETDELLAIYKPRTMLRHHLRIIDEIAPRNVLELGIFRGGSVAFLAMALRPVRLSAVDLSPRREPSLDAFLREHRLDDVVRLHYGVDQADASRLRQVVDADFGTAPLDLVIDDASHLYDATVASFETLFPLVRPGGYYVIEDWWGEQRWIDLLLGVFASPPDAGSGGVTDTIAEALTGPPTGGTAAMRWWIARSLTDDGARDHPLVTSWLDAVERAPSSPVRDGLVDNLRGAVRELEAGTLPRVPTLLTMGAELMIASAVAPDAIASVSAADGLIVVGRGERPLDPERFRLADVAVDRLDVLASIPERPVHR